MPVFPGSRIGIIGGGQLGRMLILECRRMGYHSAVLDPDLDGPAAQVADEAYLPENAADFAARCDVATYEFEHVDIDVVRGVEKNIAVYPPSGVLEIKQSRASEKTFLQDKGFPLPKFHLMKEGSGLAPLLEKGPLVVKTSKGGYDGKGLFVVKSQKDLDAVKGGLDQEIVAEEFVNFHKEISVLCARNKKGGIVLYPVVENVHDNGILLFSIAPAGISEKARRMACEIASGLAEKLELVGILCVEMFLAGENELLINEFAPRPHNSGHFTLDSCDISQFEMLLRSICGLPMTVPDLLCPAAMLNILGKSPSELDYGRILSVPGAKVHLYGKKASTERRKMGHINILGKTQEDVLRKLDHIRGAVYGA